MDSRLVKRLALNIGFSDCGTASADSLETDEFPLYQWIEAGYHADMRYMERNKEMRYDPRLLLDGARTVISLVLAYKPDKVATGNLRISQYAYSEDYHSLMKRMMFSLMAELKRHYPDFEGRPFVDTAPISDRHWAVRAGLGCIGRNGLFVHPVWGSMCYLGEIVTTSEIDPSSLERRAATGPQADLCGDCTRCIEACPNNAIVKLGNNYVVDSRRCTSYNTIENRSERLPDTLDTKGYIFGCDICQQACPLNADVVPSLSINRERLDEIVNLPHTDEEGFRRFARHSAMSRIGFAQLRRNIDFSKDHNQHPSAQ